ncbi:MAG: alpha-hydroxy-acid oxidizing protein [Acidobacteriia bacterium]|nr:alpha-hydroxy-acid oxidizing protein [Terriglobia bacterium]
MNSENTRRKFLRLLAASPVLAVPGVFRGSLESFLSTGEFTGGEIREFLENPLERAASDDAPIASAEQAINVMDFEPAARKAIPVAHFGYLATGVDDDATVRINHEGYSKIQIRPRRLVDVSKLNTSVRIFGASWETPIVLAPVSALKAFHPEGEIAVARAAKVKGHLQMLSTVGTSSIEEVTAARGTPVWQQLYPTNDWSVGRAIVKRAEAAGSPVIVLTLDLQDDSNRETLRRAMRADTRPCKMCHAEGMSGYLRRKPMFDGLDVSRVTGLHAKDMNWDVVKRLRDTTTMKVVLKGIVTREDAQLAIEHGVDGIIVSNHGGRSEETLRPTIESLPEVLEGVAGKIPVLVDGGIRRGVDIFKALATGATAVCIGRPYAWGLGAFGQPGVEAVLAILRRELEAIMRQAGTPAIDRITRTFLAGGSSK